MKPVIAYGVLVYGCTTKHQLRPIYLLQKKVLRMIYFKANTFSSALLFERSRIKSVYDMYCVELLKFVLKSARGRFCSSLLNGLLTNEETNVYNTRSASLNLKCLPLCRNNFLSFSLRNRGRKMENILRTLDLFPNDLHTMNDRSCTVFVRNISSAYIVHSETFIDAIFC